MMAFALLFAASTVLLCVFCLLCKRAKHANLKTAEEQAAAYERLCQRYDRGTRALQIEPRELMAKIKNGASVTILDTRSPAEHAVSCVQGPSGPAKLFVPARPEPWGGRVIPMHDGRVMFCTEITDGIR